MSKLMNPPCPSYHFVI